MGSFPETYINPLFLDQFKAWIYRKLVSGKVRKILFSVVKREYSALVLSWCVAVTIFWGPFLESLDNFSGPKSAFVFTVFAWDQSFNNFENDTMKLSVNEAKLTGLWARNFTTIQLLLISKFAFGPEKLPGRSRNGPLHCLLWGSRARTFQTIHYTTFQELYFNYNLFKWLKWNSHISSNDLRFPFFPIILPWYYMINYPGGRGLLGWTPTPL